MRLPLSLLHQFIKTKRSPQEIADALMLCGTEIDEILYPKERLQNVIVGEVTEVNKHENADRLNVVSVKTGLTKRHTIVCGAPNVSVGQKVAVALPGTKLPNGLSIKKSDIRGVVSEGMICSEDELGIGDDHTGIIVLDKKSKIGAPITKALLSSEAVIDCDVTRNRADLFSVEGLARDFAASEGKKIREMAIKQALPQATTSRISVSLQKNSFSNSYSAVLIENVTQAESPQWLVTALNEMGGRSINSIVDITNYVMFLLGQPLHAFDADTLAKKDGRIEIHVRAATKRESIQALDGKEYALTEENIVIADALHPIAIAGVIGGGKTCVTKKTKNVLLESALFDPTIIRKSAQRLGIRTESSTRFEKNLSQENVLRAQAFATECILNLAGGTVIERAEEKMVKQDVLKTITVPIRFLEKRIGVKIANKTIQKFLTDMGFSVGFSADEITITPPWWRRDITIPEDIVEEVVRMYDMNRLPKTALRGEIKLPQEDLFQKALRTTREVLRGKGFHEIISYPYYSSDDRKSDALSMFCDGRFDHIALANPLRPEQKFLRKSIIPFILKALAKNTPFTQMDTTLKLYEIGKTYIRKGTGLPKEDTLLTGVVSCEKDYLAKNTLMLRSVIENILDALTIDTGRLRVSSVKGDEIIFYINGKLIAAIQPISIVTERSFKLKKPAVLFEIALSSALTLPRKKKIFTILPVFPFSAIDVSIVVPEKTLWGDIEKEIYSVGGNLREVYFVDQYDLKDKTKSVTFRMIFRADDRTLTSDAIEDEVSEVVSLLKKRFHATLRT